MTVITKKRCFLLVCILLADITLQGCGGRTANPVMSYQYGDEKRSCNALRAEISSVEQEISRLIPDSEKTGKNVALGLAGLLIWPIWFAWDFGDAEKVEIKALRQRYNGLIAIAGDKQCGFDVAPIPEIKAPVPATSTTTPMPGEWVAANQPEKPRAQTEQNEKKDPSPRAQTTNNLQTAPSNTSSLNPETGGGNALQKTGTGFLFNQGFVFTNHHVVRGARTITVKTADGEKHNATMAIGDEFNDIALLRLDSIPKTSSGNLSIGDATAMKPGDNVFTIGFPISNVLGHQARYSEGTINAIVGIKDDPKMFQISVPIQSGNSGGPLFNSKGEVVGMVSASLDKENTFRVMGNTPENVNFAIKSDYLKNIMRQIPEALISPTDIVVIAKDDTASKVGFIERIRGNIVLVEVDR